MSITTGIAGEVGLYPARCVSQRPDIDPLELHVDRISGREQVRREDQLHRIGDVPHDAPPALRHVAGLDGALLGGHQLEHHLAEVRVARSLLGRSHRCPTLPIAKGLIADGGQHVQDEALVRCGELGIDFGAELLHRRLEVADCGFGHLGRACPEAW